MKNAIVILTGIALFFGLGSLVGGMIQLPGYCDPEYLVILEVLIGAYVIILSIVSIALIITTVRDNKYISIGVLAIFFSGIIPGILYLIWKPHDNHKNDGSFYLKQNPIQLTEEEINQEMDDLDEMKLRGIIRDDEYQERKEKLLRK